MVAYMSDTAAGVANQTWFAGDGQPLCGRVYLRLTCGGERYRFAFSDVLDGTFADGSHSRANDVCGGWELLSMRVGLCGDSSMEHAVEPSDWREIVFDGSPSVTVASACVLSDPVSLSAAAGQTLCAELTVRGTRLPCHEELQVASFVRTADGFVPSKRLPMPCLTAVERQGIRLCFLGDSITQGIGATPNAYGHTVARLAKALSSTTAVWNLGVGFARSGDAASGGVWLHKAIQNDAAVVCLGVNDLMNGVAVDTVLENLRTVVRRLRAAGVRVLLQSVPPFEFPKAAQKDWRELNRRLPSIAVEADAFFDVVPFLCEADGAPFYGGHPNDEGCAVWAEALLPTLRCFLGID